MPTLKKIVVQDFRNIAFQELSFSPNVNCISGNRSRRMSTASAGTTEKGRRISWMRSITCP